MPADLDGRAPLDLSLYLVTDTALCGALGVPATVAAAVAGGVTAVQLREPAAPDGEVVALGRLLVRELGASGVPLIVNDRAHLVGAIGAAGAHVGQGDAAVAGVRALLGPRAYVGLSVQAVAHLEPLRALPAGTVDYLGVGPVWPQLTKPDAAAPGGLDTLAAITAAAPLPCVAIGGVTAGRAAAVRARGAAGLAVVSAVCGRPDPAAAARDLRRAWDAARPGAPATGGAGRREQSVGAGLPGEEHR